MKPKFGKSEFASPSQTFTPFDLRLFFKRVSHKRVDLQDNSKWPSGCMPDSLSNKLTWTILRSGPGWLLILEERSSDYVDRVKLPLRNMYKI